MSASNHQQTSLNRAILGICLAGSTVAAFGAIGMFTFDGEAQAQSFAVASLGIGLVASGVAAEGMSSLRNEENTCHKISHAIYKSGITLGAIMCDALAVKALLEGEMPDAKYIGIAAGATWGIMLTGLIGQCATETREWYNRQAPSADLESGTAPVR